MAAPVDRLVQALDATEALIAAVGNDQWANPTPCPEWDVRTLVNHLVFGNRIFAAILRNEPASELENLRRLHDIDQLGDNPVEAYREAGAALQAAFSQPGVLERVFQAPIGPAPGAVMLHLRITELLVHGWDLAHATGQPARLPDDVAEEELAFASGQRAPDVPRTGHPVGPSAAAARSRIGPDPIPHGVPDDTGRRKSVSKESQFEWHTVPLPPGIPCEA